LLPPLHVTLVPAMLTDTPDAGWVITTVVVAVQPLASVVVTVYVPAASVVLVAEVPPPLHA
jgi:hypothetical protein